MPSTPSRSVLRPAGNITISELGGKLREADTHQCVHCGCHWAVVKDSGKVRGYCRGCKGPHCGAPACWDCYPLEKQLDDAERGILNVPILGRGPT